MAGVAVYASGAVRRPNQAEIDAAFVAYWAASSPHEERIAIARARAAGWKGET